MNPTFSIRSSDPALLEKAIRVADDFAAPFHRAEVAGIVYLGAIVRGYYDPEADIDIAIFTRSGAQLGLPGQFLRVEGLEVHVHTADLEQEARGEWDMPKRWTFAQGRIEYDPQGEVARLLAEKVPLRPDERRWLLMSGLALSEWYIHRLTHLWVQRGDLVSAHDMFAPGLKCFFDLLFALNGALVPDVKWRYYCAQQLERLPERFRERTEEVLVLHALTEQELERREAAFMGMWRELCPLVEAEVGLSFEKINELV